MARVLGRDRLAKSNFEVGSCVVNMCWEHDMGKLRELLETYAEVFSGEPGMIKPFDAKLVLRKMWSQFFLLQT